MSKNKPVDWQTTADILDSVPDDEWDAAIAKLNEGPSAGEEVEQALEMFQKMGLFDIGVYEDEDDQ